MTTQSIEGNAGDYRTWPGKINQVCLIACAVSMADAAGCDEGGHFGDGEGGARLTILSGPGGDAAATIPLRHGFGIFRIVGEIRRPYLERHDMKVFGIAVLLLFAVVATVCECAVAETPSDSKSNGGTDAPAPKALPAEYRALASILLAARMKAGAGTNVPELIAAAQSDVMDLRKIHSDDDEINQVAALGIDA